MTIRVKWLVVAKVKTTVHEHIFALFQEMMDLLMGAPIEGDSTGYLADR